MTKNSNSEAMYTKKLLKELGRIDTWRELHPNDKCFNFFSHPHGVYSRIDYLFVFNFDRHRITKCEIGMKDISDHAEVYMTLHLDSKAKETLLRLNTSLLNDSH